VVPAALPLMRGWRTPLASESALSAGRAGLRRSPGRPSRLRRRPQDCWRGVTALSRAMTSSAWGRGQTGSRTANSSPPQRQRMSNVAELAVPGRCRFQQQSIAGLVAVRVVERLEVVDVEQRDGQRLTGSPRSRQLAGELLIPAAAVGQPCERLRSRQTRQHTHLLAERLDLAHKRCHRGVAGGPRTTKPPIPLAIGLSGTSPSRSGPTRPVAPKHLYLARLLRPGRAPGPPPGTSGRPDGAGADSSPRRPPARPVGQVHGPTASATRGRPAAGRRSTGLPLRATRAPLRSRRTARTREPDEGRLDARLTPYLTRKPLVPLMIRAR
jgi:hypothetical protein